MTLPHPRLLLLCFSLLPLAWSGCGSAPTGPAAAAQPAALKHYVITDYGAVGDGATMNTAFIQKAIDTASAAGGGVLEIPQGTFLSGSIFLKPGVELYLDAGAVLLGSQNITDYPKQMTRIEGHFEPWRLALLNVSHMDHVRIGGPGQLNGNGQPYWTLFYSRRAANPATTNLDVERPRLVFIDHCADVRVENISLQDSGFWNLHLFYCHDVLVQGLRINAASPSTGGRSPSTDGIDIDLCQNVTVRQCQISNNDDDIGIKGSKGPLADHLGDPPDENILIEDCTIGDGNGLLTCGSEATVVRNVLVRNCAITGNAKMLNLKLRPDTPEHYSNITVDGVKLSGTGAIITVAPWTQFFDLQGHPGPARFVDHITVRNITGNFGSFGSVRGNVANPLRGTLTDTLSDFTFENINVNLRNPTLSRGEVNNLVFKNVIVNGQPVEAPPVTAAPRARGAPAAVAPLATLPPVTIHLAGDSTVCNYPSTTVQEGWGMELGQFFNDQVKVDNQAQGGANVQSFKNSGRWTAILAALQPGDYVLMQFGANDSGTAHGPVSPPDFVATLGQMADEVRAKGATPIFVTPSAFYQFSGGKQDNARLAPYAAACYTAGTAKNVLVDDLNARGVEWLNSVGPTTAATFYLPVRGQPDKAHFVKSGATQMAQMVAQEIRRINSPLAAYLK